ncbi:MAG: gephyrin-like molybdotransferase Glp [Chloroflexota bacterium]
MPSDGMISVEEAQERILAVIQPLETESQPLVQALGQTLAGDIRAPFNVPPMSNSAMDGYALRHADIAGASAAAPVTLQIVGLAAAGHPSTASVRPGTAVRIMTGAPVPPGADTVVPFEETDEMDQRARGARSADLQRIDIRTGMSLGACVRPAGGDAPEGALIIQRGTVLGPAHIGVIASLGLGQVSVIRRAVVAILATGDELREPGEPLGSGQIYNSNTYTTAAQVLACGATPSLLPIARDTVEDLKTKIQQGLGADLFITSAGVSTGEYDLVKDVLISEGTMDFWRVRMRPGKPLAFGLLRRSGRPLPHLGLPGNPVSSMIAFDQFARPAILKLMGQEAEPQPTIKAILDEPVSNGDGRRFFARVVVSRQDGHYHARLTGSQDSNVLTSMASANGLLVLREERQRVGAGEEVEVQLLQSGWGIRE